MMLFLVLHCLLLVRLFWIRLLSIFCPCSVGILLCSLSFGIFLFLLVFHSLDSFLDGILFCFVVCILWILARIVFPLGFFGFLFSWSVRIGCVLCCFLGFFVFCRLCFWLVLWSCRSLCCVVFLCLFFLWMFVLVVFLSRLVGSSLLRIWRMPWYLMGMIVRSLFRCIRRLLLVFFLWGCFLVFVFFVCSFRFLVLRWRVLGSSSLLEIRLCLCLGWVVFVMSGLRILLVLILLCSSCCLSSEFVYLYWYYEWVGVCFHSYESFVLWCESS